MKNHHRSRSSKTNILISLVFLFATVSLAEEVVDHKTSCSAFLSLKAKRLCKIRQDERRKREQQFWDYTMAPGLNDLSSEEKDSTEATLASSSVAEAVTAEVESQHSSSKEYETTTRAGMATTTTRPVTYVVPQTTTSHSLDWDLPDCDDLDDEEPEEGFNCVAAQPPPEPEIRWRDPVFEEIFRQAWRSNNESFSPDFQIFNSTLDPLDVDKVMGEGIDRHVEGLVSADLKMWNIKLQGLSTERLVKVLATRSQDLKDLHLELEFSFDDWLVYGDYRLKGYFGFFEINSKGERPFSIEILKPSLHPDIFLEAIPEGSNECGTFSTLKITKLEMPLKFSKTEVIFENLGSFYNQALNSLSAQIMKVQEATLVEKMQEMITQFLNGTIC